MDGGGRSFVLHIVVLCLTQCYNSHADILQGPSNVTVLAGSNASFVCTVDKGWQSLTWFINGIFSVSITPTSGTVVQNPQITVTNSTNTGNEAFTSQITIINVSYSNSGMIQCNVLEVVPKDAYLTVQVDGSLKITNGSITTTPNSTVYLACEFLNWFPVPLITWQLNNTDVSNSQYITDFVRGSDNLVSGTSMLRITAQDNVIVTCLANIDKLPAPKSTSVDLTIKESTSGGSMDKTTIIIIAVTVSLGCLLILIIIIVTIVCCRKKKKREPSYGDRWKTSQQNSEYLRRMEDRGFGENNSAYTPEPSPLPDNSFIESNGYSEIISNRIPQSQVSVSGDSDTQSRKIRHLTLV
ncbi:immunoglobulin superfamily member 5 isoform X1 [Pelobates fuscus]|uniref:immunoglobulin superfamily member 5 isoform X1 n=1 Tax=Pelobates fuscus TaxID=191477 RepID=UPI002FE4E8D6